MSRRPRTNRLTIFWRELPRRGVPWILIGWTVLVSATSAVGPEAQEIRYLYDDLNRLVGVIDQQGNAATYEYDAVGNLLRITRRNVADVRGPVAITLLSPNHGAAGTAVEVFGAGFNATLGNNQVTFNGVAATVSAASPTRLQTSVPPGATTGPVTVAVAAVGSATSPESFTVVDRVAIDPPSLLLLPGQTRQFVATVPGAADQRVTWKVNGIPGGNAAGGTVTATGLYTAPAAVPKPTSVTLEAQSVPFPDLRAQAPIALSAGAYAETAVSVVVGLPPGSLQARPVSVQAGPPGPALAGPVSVATGPALAAVTPASALRGTANLAFSLTGANLANPTALTFLVNGVRDTGIAVTNLTANPEGTEATATLSVGGTATPGRHVVVLTTAAGVSTYLDIGTNAFTVQ